MTDLDGIFIREPSTESEFVVIYEQGRFSTPIAMIPFHRWKIICDRIEKAIKESKVERMP